MQLLATLTATALALGHRALAQQAIQSGTGFGTYYYDIEQPQTCGADFSQMNTGNVQCNNAALPLITIGSNYVVAMNRTQLGENLELYCGKKVAVTINGVKSDIPLFIGDGCERCSGGLGATVYDPNASPGLDFSYTVMTEMLADTCQLGHTAISWEILDETLYEFQPIWQA